MRLTQEQISSILEIVKQFAGKDATVYLFGSRLNDRAKGGDVDLLIETGKPLTLLDRAHIKMHLEKKLGLPVDVIVQNRNDLSSYNLAYLNLLFLFLFRLFLSRL